MKPRYPNHKSFIHNALLAAVAILLISLLSGCAADEQPTADTGHFFEVVSGDMSRDLNPDTPEADLDACVMGNTQFAVDLYGQLALAAAASNDNLFYSPYSISVAISMVYGGARNETQNQIQSTLHFDLATPALFQAFNSLDLALSSRGQNASGMDGTPFQLHIVNDTWGQKDFGFLPEYLNLLSGYYGADLKVLDFVADPETARANINEYIYEQTSDRISDLLPAGSISPLTRLVLTNAIHFNAAWANPFETDLTTDQPFTAIDGTENNVAMMQQTEWMPYLAGDGFDAVALSYDGGEMSMVFIVPDEGTFADFENELSATLIQSIFDNLEGESVKLSLPSFEYDAGVSLKEHLIALGMVSPFDETADFSGIDGATDLLIGGVYHKAFVKVNENGTEAAAATAVVVDFKSGIADATAEVTLNRPFIFLIRDNATDTVLFAGRIVKL
ncbi:MAG: serpin family protein [Deltaproteobacteria bacterium]|nr:serpin family protein [Deltaproteobacteria bacterium]